jgi:hypothetical protein
LVRPVLAVLIVLAGCGGGSSPPAGSPATRATSAEGRADGARATARAFARAVLSGRTARMCRLLRGQARRVQACGRESEDFGPLLRVTIRAASSVRVVAVDGDTARVVFPRLGRDAKRRPQATWCRPQRMRLERRGGRWYVVELRYRSDFEPAPRGCAPPE